MSARRVGLALCLVAAASSADAAPLMDGPVAGGAFGMGGSDYYGEIRERAPGEAQAARPLPVRRHRAHAGAEAHVHRPAKAGGTR